MNSSRPKKRKPERSLTRSFVVTVAVAIPGAMLVNTAGCGTGADPAAGAGGGSSGNPGIGSGDTGPCDNEGAQRPCHTNLGKDATGKIQSCFSGTQTCTGGLWSGCGGDGTITNLAAFDAQLQGGLTTQSHKGGAVCGDGNCTSKTCVGGSNNGQNCPNGNECGGGGTCTGGSGTETCGNCPADCGICPAGAPSAGAAVCTADPCNPDCLGFAQSGPVSSAAGVGGTVIGVSGFGQIPNGQIKKLLLDSCQTGTACDNFSAPGLPSSYYNCQVDTYCQMSALGGDGCCHQFAPVGVQGTDPDSLGASNTGVDITIGPGCSDNESDKYRYFPICNRGTLPVPAGTKILVKYYNPNQSFSPCNDTACTPGAGWDCSMTVSAAGLLPGVCELLDTQCPTCALGGGACSQPNGDKWLYANCNGGAPVGAVGIAEGNLVMRPGAGPIGVTGAPANEPTTAPGILGCANNMTDHSPNNNPPACGVLGQNTFTFSNVYKAVCPPGTGPVWNKLIYNSTCPKSGGSSSEVFFEASFAPDIGGGVPGTFGTPYELAEAANNSTASKDPEICNFTSPSPQLPGYAWPTCTSGVPGVAGAGPDCCPKDIETLVERAPGSVPFGGAGPGPGALEVRKDFMKLQITLKSTLDNKKDATLNSWSVSYQCVARE